MTHFEAMTTFDQTSLKFEVLCIDQKGKVPFNSEKKFIYALLFNDQLWDEEEIEPIENICGFLDKKKGIKVLIQKIDTSKVVSDLFASAFILTLEGKYNELEPLRLSLLLHLRRLEFNHVRILNDEISAYIATQIYPSLNKLENLLRRYIVKFFTTKIGLNWWEIAVTKEVRDKASFSQNQKNEKIFTYINADVSWTHFNEIGEIIYQQKTAFSKVEDIVNRIESATSIDELKAEIQGNHAKYFKKYFERTDFEKKWKRCYEIRNKVAHNNLFQQQDLNDANDLIESLIKIINDADEKIDEVVFSIAEKEAIKIATEKAELDNSQSTIMETEREIIRNEDQILSDNQQFLTLNKVVQPYKLISEEEVIEELAKAEKEEFKNGFVGLRRFVTEVLGSQGYSYSVSYAVINILADKGDIKMYDVDNPNGLIKAIKLSQDHSTQG